MKIGINYIKSELVFFIFFFLFIVLIILYPNQIAYYYTYVDWKTIIVLSGLLIVATGLKESGYFRLFAEKNVTTLKNEREVAIFLIFVSAFLSTFLTNDITLFIVIPLTMLFQDIIKNDISKLIIFEAISANIGSALTPIGNPQNLYLWHKWGISFISFIVKMLPLVVLLLGVLLIFAWNVFPNKKICVKDTIHKRESKEKGLFIVSGLALLGFIVCLECNRVYLPFFIIFMIYFIFYRRILIRNDWVLILLFIIIFIDFHVISILPIIVKLVSVLHIHDSHGNVFLFSLLASQCMSNVPASVFLSKFSHSWLDISYGVTIGGNGVIWSSLANIIALRISKKKRMWIDFHKYSIPYFLTTTGLIYILFYIV